MKILFDNNTTYNIDENTFNLINKCIEETLKTENFTNNVEISLSIVNNEEIRKLNSIHRNIDKETDVLSFPMLEEFNNIENNLLHPIIL